MNHIEFDLNNRLVIGTEDKVDKGNKELILETYIDAAFAIHPYRESPLCYSTLIGETIIETQLIIPLKRFQCYLPHFISLIKW